MNDRELLELAAKAAGHTTRSDDLDVWIVEDDGSPVERWNPLNDDAQAMRLVVKLHIALQSYKEIGNVYAHTKHSLGVGTGGYHSYQAHELMTETLGDDPMAATRRAIVRAAAELGKTRSD